MSVIKIKKALERNLNSMSPVLPIAFEGVSFTPPEGEMYQSIQFRFETPDDRVISKDYHRERLTVQIAIIGINGFGANDVLERAEAVREQFKKGTVLIEDGVTVRILYTPQITGVAPAQDRLVCPILVSAIAEVPS